MGFSVTITEIIMVIGAVLLASAFVACAFYAGNILQSEVEQGVSNAKANIDTQVDIVYATANTTKLPIFVIYAKNTGNLPITDYQDLDVYVGDYGSAQLYTYSSNACQGSGTFNIVSVTGNGTWEPLETAIIYAYPSQTISGTVFEAKVVPATGVGNDYIFSTAT